MPDSRDRGKVIDDRGPGDLDASPAIFRTVVMAAFIFAAILVLADARLGKVTLAFQASAFEAYPLRFS